MRLFVIATILSFSTTLMASNEKTLSCPGFELVKTCGNRVCEEDKNETIENCPADCIQTEIRSYNHQTLCDNHELVHIPANEEETVSIVRQSIKDGFKVRAIGKLHSANNQLCTDGVLVSTQKLNKIHGLEEFQGEETVLVDAGVTINDLSEWLYERGRSIGMTMIGFNGVSVAGSTATGSHGSSIKHPTVMASLIRSIDIITPAGELRTYHANNTSPLKWKALRSSLGMLGVITKLRLKTSPAFNLEAKVDYLSEKKLLKENGYRELVGECDWGQINWFPKTGMLMRSCAVKTDKPAEEGAENKLLWPSVDESFVSQFKQALQLGACFKPLNRTLEGIRFLNFRTMPPFVKIKDDEEVSTHNLVGKSHKISSSPFISIKEGFFQMDWELAIPQKNITAALQDVKKISDKYNMSLPLIGAFIRFTKVEDTTLLAHSSAGGAFKVGEDVAFIELPVYLPVGFDEQRLEQYTAPFNEFVNTMIEKHQARAHWGKNKNWVFKKQLKLGSYQNKMGSFQAVLTTMDIFGVHANTFGKEIGFNWLNLGESLSSPCSSVPNKVCTKFGKSYVNKCQALMAGEREEDLRTWLCL